MQGTPTVPCLVTPTWTSSVQLVLSRVNSAKCKNVVELLHVGLHAGTFNETSSVRLLYHDYRVIAALLKKNKAQHRAGRWWQRLEGVRRSLQKVFVGNVHDSQSAPVATGDDRQNGQHGQKSTSSTSSASSTSVSIIGFLHALDTASKPVTKHQERQVPTRRMCLAVASALYQRLQVLETLLERAYAAATACLAQLSHTFFMPLSLTGCSLAGRVYAIGVQLVREGVHLYNLVRGELMELLPGDPMDSDGACGDGVPVAAGWNDEQTGMEVPEKSVLPERRILSNEQKRAIPHELQCHVNKDKPVRVKIIGDTMPENDTVSVPQGLQILGSDQQTTHVPLSGLVVEEDHGQVVSRDEAYAALGLSTSGKEHVVDVFPVFEESNIRIEEASDAAPGFLDSGPTKRQRVHAPPGNDQGPGKETEIETEREGSIGAIGTTSKPSSTAAGTATPRQSAAPATSVQFIRVGAPTQASAPPVPPAAAPVPISSPPVKPLLVRLEEEKKRKRKKKRDSHAGQPRSTSTPWDDLFN